MQRKADGPNSLQTNGGAWWAFNKAQCATRCYIHETRVRTPYNLRRRERGCRRRRRRRRRRPWRRRRRAEREHEGLVRSLREDGLRVGVDVVSTPPEKSLSSLDVASTPTFDAAMSDDVDTTPCDEARAPHP